MWTGTSVSIKPPLGKNAQKSQVVVTEDVEVNTMVFKDGHSHVND
jgi:hypothetical protein